MTTPPLTSSVQIIGGEEDLIVEEIGVTDLRKVTTAAPSAGKWLLTLSTILQDQPWVLVCTSQTPLRIQSISSSDVSSKHGTLYPGPRSTGAPGNARDLRDFPDCFDTIVVDRVRPKR